MSFYNRIEFTRLASEMMHSNECLDIIKFFEQCRLTAYYDAVGVLTIGYGSTKNVYEGMTITIDEAISRLVDDVYEHSEFVRDYVKVPLTQWEFDSLVSWTFNLGGGALQDSTMLKVLNSEEIDEVPYQMMRWAFGGGKWLRGLARRRHAEALLFTDRHWDELHKDFRGFNKRRYKRWIANHKYDLGLTP